MSLFLELRKHGKLAAKRHPMYEKSKFAKVWIYIVVAFWIGYLLFFGTTFGFVMGGGPREAYHVLNSGLVFFLFLDFLIRWPFQKTPTQEVKPYLLLPIKKRRLIDFLLIRSGLDGFNLFWLFFFVPFAIISITRFYGVGGVLTYCIGIWLLFVLNNYWFLLCRTLADERVWWYGLPLGVYGALAAALFIPEDSPIFDWSLEVGEWMIHGNLTVYVGLLALIALFWFINRSVMARLIYNELNKVEDTTVQVKHVSEYKFLDRYGEVGEYMRLELKLMLRNKICRRSLYSVMATVVIFSILIGFTDIYQGSMKEFLVLYNFLLFGLLFLSPLMSYEGNYIDGLMSRKESIYALLQAKYIIYSVGLIIPFILMIPAMVMGATSVLTCISWMIFIAGAVYFLLFRIAMYNKHTIDLNTKVAGRQNMGTGMQQLVGFLTFLLPIIATLLLDLVAGKEYAPWGLIVIGLGFILTSRLWLKGAYRRFMKRRYVNLEGFRDSRQK